MSLKRAHDYSSANLHYQVVAPAKKSRFMSYATPMNIQPTYRKKTTQFKKKSYPRKRYTGPYNALVSNCRHTHPVYPIPEVKFHDAGPDGNAPTLVPTILPMDDNGTVSCLNFMTSSSASSTAVSGFQCAIKSCAYRFEVDIATTTPVQTSGRVVLVWDKQPNAAVAAYTAIFTAANFLSFMNMQNKDRFVILRNQQFALSPNGDEALFFEGFCKINMTSTYPVNGTAAVPLTGALLLAFVSDQSVAASQPTLNGTWRVRYIDN